MNIIAYTVPQRFASAGGVNGFDATATVYGPLPVRVSKPTSGSRTSELSSLQNMIYVY